MQKVCEYVSDNVESYDHGKGTRAMSACSPEQMLCRNKAEEKEYEARIVTKLPTDSKLSRTCWTES